MLITSGPEDRLALSCKDYIGGINAGPCALDIMDILFGDCWCIITHLVDSCCIISEIKCHRTPTHVTKAFFSLSFSLWQLWCKWGVKSSWYAWVCPPGHSPLGSSTSFVSRAGGQECVSNVHMNKCRLCDISTCQRGRSSSEHSAGLSKLAFWSHAFTYVTQHHRIMYVSLQWSSVPRVNNYLTRVSGEITSLLYDTGREIVRFVSA